MSIIRIIVTGTWVVIFLFNLLFASYLKWMAIFTYLFVTIYVISTRTKIIVLLYCTLIFFFLKRGYYCIFNFRFCLRLDRGIRTWTWNLLCWKIFWFSSYSYFFTITSYCFMVAIILTRGRRYLILRVLMIIPYN